ncbi:MAG: chromosomal replication initiator protein DnaA [Oscillospiraceae bacterium]|jgi:chromosomal replication initiator protein
MNSPSDVWARVLKLLESDLTPTSIATWFDDSQAVEMTDDLFVIALGSNLKKDVVSKRYTGLIKKALREIFSGEYDIMVLSPDELISYRRSGEKNYSYARPDFTFDNFVIGASNKFAAAAAKAVADNPAGSYNPLLIYGDSGLGKTHLLYAIANEIRRKHPEFKIIYIKGDDFTNEMVSAIQQGKNREFREKYRYADLFLADDIQFIAGKKQTQEEFFHTFNTLYESKKQIVLTSDRPPKEMRDLENRLQTRFEWGLLADIQPPELETRMAIIRKKAAELGITIPDAVVEYIAINVSANVRQLEGTVRKLMALNDLMKENMDVGTVSHAVRDVVKGKVDSEPTPDVIIEEVSKYYIINPETIRGQRRSKETALARQISMYLIRSMTNMSLTDIGREFDGRDHTTVLSSIRRIENYVSESESFAQTIRDIKANINARY